MSDKRGVIFYRSWWETITKHLEPEERLEIYEAIFTTGFDNIPVDNLSTDSAQLVYDLIKPQLDANFRKYQNGKTGGRPGTINRDIVLKMSQKGHTQCHIAEVLGCSRRQVNRILSEASEVGHKTKAKNKNKNKNKKENDVTETSPLPLVGAGDALEHKEYIGCPSDVREKLNGWINNIGGLQ